MVAGVAFLLEADASAGSPLDDAHVLHCGQARAEPLTSLMGLVARKRIIMKCT